MIKVSNLKLPINYDDKTIIKSICKKIKIKPENIIDFELIKRSLDARKKNNIFYNISVKIETNLDESKLIKKLKSNDVSIFREEKYLFNSANNKNITPLIVGSGPAGLFCAYTLIKSGIKPIIFERGEKIEDRIQSVERFFESGVLNTESNIQFGEGGAGTFSDGKLNTGIKDNRIKLVLETFVKFGAPENILYDNKPHIGTDILRKVIVNFRNYIIDNGGVFHFSTKFVDFKLNNDKIVSAIFENNGELKEIDCDYIVLAIGHSARDTFYKLYDKNVSMTQKAFSIGARIEHSQEFINKLQYGEQFENAHLPVADYKTSVHLDNGRSVYSFCMCPGGYVVAAASEENQIVTNGMSNYLRNGSNANSAILVNVVPEDFGSNHPLAGIELQRKIEKDAYNISNSYKAPAQTLESLIYGGENKIKSVSPTYRPDVVLCDLRTIFPDFIYTSLKEGLVLIDKKLHGFASPEAILIAPETRSSSPVRILRDDNFNSNFKRLLPCGEGAGYAGGITSAAVDGIKVAEQIIKG